MIKLKDYSTKPPKSLSKKETRALTKDLADRIGELHDVLIAERKYSVLVILQGMDGSGKDGGVRNVFKECTANGLSVYSFKKRFHEQ